MAKSKQTGGKYKLTLSVDHEFARRFGAFAHFIDEDMSEIVVRAVRREMKGFRISRTVEGEGESDAPDGATVRMSRQAESREAG